MSLNETYNTKRFNYAMFGALGLAGTVIAGSLILSSQESNLSPEQTYSKDFTDKGKCLDGTRFDSAQGALVHENKIDGTEVLSVMPPDANFHDPSVLFLAVNRNNGHTNLRFADSATATFLAKQACPGQPDGY